MWRGCCITGCLAPYLFIRYPGYIADCIGSAANVVWLSFLKLNLRHSHEINIWNLYNLWTSSLLWIRVPCRGKRSPIARIWMDRHVQIKGVLQAGKRWDYSTWQYRREPEGDTWMKYMGWVMELSWKRQWMYLRRDWIATHEPWIQWQPNYFVDGSR